MTQLAALLASASLGAIMFFSAAIAPTIFQALPEKEVGKSLRAVFPKYFLVNGIVAAVAGLLAAEPLPSALLLASAATMIVVRFGAISVINQARDAMVAGDGPAGRKFERWHRATVVINIVEMAALLDSNSAVAASMIDDFTQQPPAPRRLR